MLDIVWIVFAFGAGLLARQLGLPPLVGYLVAGFVLHGFGQEPNETISRFAELGVTLLLFTIGLKLKLGSLAQPQIWAVAGVHLVLVDLVLMPVLLGLGALGLPYLADLEWTSATILAFALSFSSTVFAVKLLEEKGELGSYYGTLAIGILIMQDLEAVVFLGISAGKVPSLWALSLLLLIPARPLILKLLERSGHGELLVLFGLTLAVGGYHVFELVEVKGDLGALILGIMCAPSQGQGAGEGAPWFQGSVPDRFFPEHRSRRGADPVDAGDRTGAGGGLADQVPDIPSVAAPVPPARPHLAARLFDACQLQRIWTDRRLDRRGEPMDR